MAINISNGAADAGGAAILARLNNGYLRIYSGTQPANVNTALSGNTLLAELRFSATAFGAGANGVFTANAITQDSAADATGTPSFFRAFQSDGTTAEMDGTVGSAGADLNLTGLSGGQIIAGGPVNVSSFQYTQTK